MNLSCFKDLCYKSNCHNDREHLTLNLHENLCIPVPIQRPFTWPSLYLPRTTSGDLAHDDTEFFGLAKREWPPSFAQRGLEIVIMNYASTLIDLFSLVNVMFLGYPSSAVCRRVCTWVMRSQPFVSTCSAGLFSSWVSPKALESP